MKIRHGPATVIGEPFGKVFASHWPGLLGREETKDYDPRVRRPVAQDLSLRRLSGRYCVYKASVLKVWGLFGGL